MNVILTFKRKDMAKAFGSVQIVGTLDDLNFYITPDGNIVREKGKTVLQELTGFTATILDNNLEIQKKNYWKEKELKEGFGFLYYNTPEVGE